MVLICGASSSASAEVLSEKEEAIEYHYGKIKEIFRYGRKAFDEHLMSQFLTGNKDVIRGLIDEDPEFLKKNIDASHTLVKRVFDLKRVGEEGMKKIEEIFFKMRVIDLSNHRYFFEQEFNKDPNSSMENRLDKLSNDDLREYYKPYYAFWKFFFHGKAGTGNGTSIYVSGSLPKVGEGVMAKISINKNGLVDITFYEEGGKRYITNEKVARLKRIEDYFYSTKESQEAEALFNPQGK